MDGRRLPALFNTEAIHFCSADLILLSIVQRFLLPLKFFQENLLWILLNDSIGVIHPRFITVEQQSMVIFLNETSLLLAFRINEYNYLAEARGFIAVMTLSHFEIHRDGFILSLPTLKS